jgi:hypothetical protein
MVEERREAASGTARQGWDGGCLSAAPHQTQRQKQPLQKYDYGNIWKNKKSQ